MELFLAMLLCLFLLTLAVIGEIYLEMDKQKARAVLCVKKMKDELDAWVRGTVELTESSDAGRNSADALATLARDYFSCLKYKETLKKIPLVNSIAAAAAPLAEAASGVKAGSILKERADAAAGLEMLRSEYNETVKKLNGRLKKRIPAAVGRLFRLYRLEELCDLRESGT